MGRVHALCPQVNPQKAPPARLRTTRLRTTRPNPDRGHGLPETPVLRAETPAAGATKPASRRHAGAGAQKMSSVQKPGSRQWEEQCGAATTWPADNGAAQAGGPPSSGQEGARR